jgi:hypothetical protein
MKKITLILTVLLLTNSFIFAQIGAEEHCVSCKGNQ